MRRVARRAAGWRRRGSPSPPDWGTPSEVVFTSGGTDSDNLAVKGIYWARRDADAGRRRIITTEVEHHAVLDSVNWLAEHEGAEITWLPTDADGSVSPDALRDELDGGRADDVALITAMWANNEVGTVLPIEELAAVAAEFDVPMHSDAVQAVGALPVDFGASGLAALSLTAHKFGGPCGTGALLVRRDISCVPLTHGGGRSAISVPAHPMSPGQSGWQRHFGSRWTRWTPPPRGSPPCATGSSTACSPVSPRPGSTDHAPDACPATRTSPSPAAKAIRC